jgi:hypothetical protein
MARISAAVSQQIESLDAIAATPDPAVGRDEVLETTLVDAHAQIVRSLEVVRAIVGQRGSDVFATPRNRPETTIAAFVARKIAPGTYERVKQRVREVAVTVLPEDTTVIVVSRGDDDLVDLGGRRGWHFPQNDDGIYAGYYPTTSQQAIRHLEALRAKGGEYLLFPANASWWLAHYGEFRRHLDGRYRLSFVDADSCAIYDLRRQLDGSSD